MPRTGVRSASFASSVEDALRDMDAYLLRHCLARRRKPQHDLISDLVTAEFDGEHLDDQEVVNFSRTTLLLDNTVLCLDEWQNAAAELRADWSVIPDGARGGAALPVAISPDRAVHHATGRALWPGDTGESGGHPLAALGESRRAAVHRRSASTSTVRCPR
jgi:hypothetical protein